MPDEGSKPTSGQGPARREAATGAATGGGDGGGGAASEGLSGAGEENKAAVRLTGSKTRRSSSRAHVRPLAAGRA